MARLLLFCYTSALRVTIYWNSHSVFWKWKRQLVRNWEQKCLVDTRLLWSSLIIFTPCVSFPIFFICLCASVLGLDCPPCIHPNHAYIYILCLHLIVIFVFPFPAVSRFNTSAMRLYTIASFCVSSKRHRILMVLPWKQRVSDSSYHFSHLFIISSKWFQVDLFTTWWYCLHLFLLASSTVPSCNWSLYSSGFWSRLPVSFFFLVRLIFILDAYRKVPGFDSTSRFSRSKRARAIKNCRRDMWPSFLYIKSGYKNGIE